MANLTSSAPPGSGIVFFYYCWGHQSVDPSCQLQLCGRPASLRHILNACPSALNQGRYTWRHDSVLRILKRHLLSFWQSPLTQSTIKDRANLSTQPYIRFVPAGSASSRSTRRSTHLYSNNHHKRHPLSSSKDLLLNSNDWEFLFDLGDSQLVFPPEIAVTTQRPDIVIFSRSKKAVLLVELTVPLEDRVAAGHTRKENRYAGLVQQCTENGWFARCFAVEVGCLGYVSPSLFHCLESLGIPSSTSRKRMCVEPMPSDDESWSLISKQKPGPKRSVLYIGNLSPETTEERLVNFIQARSTAVGVKPPNIINARMFEPREGRDRIGARLTVASSDAEVLQATNFWPRPIYARAWNFHIVRLDKPQPLPLESHSNSSKRESGADLVSA